MQIHPEQTAHAKAVFTLAGAAGKYQADTAKWTDRGGKAVFTNQVDDPANGTSDVDVSFAAYGDGENTKLNVTADGDLSAKDAEVSTDSEEIDFSIQSQIAADAVQIAVNQPAA